MASAPKLQYARLLVISDLALIKKADRDSTFIYVADARTGKPLPRANAVLKESYYDGNVRKNKVSVARGTSNATGFLDKQLMRGRGLHSRRVEAFAWVNGRYAMTGMSHDYGFYGGYHRGYDDNRDEAKVYSYTDRSVYRPEQKVYFRQILTRRIKGGAQEPIKEFGAKVSVTNPGGETIYEEWLTSSEFGTINGEFTLPKKARLGEYEIQSSLHERVWVEKAKRYGYKARAYPITQGSSRFRVEEYKRPEFLVKVETPTKPARPGEVVATKINVKYYFGSPVPNATVKYTIRRSQWWANYQFPRPFDWLYAYWGEGDYDTGRRNIGGEGSGTIVKQGTAQTDSLGNAEVSFKTVADPQQKGVDAWEMQYSNPLYTVEAEVTDASRRTIEAQGALKVASQQYFAFLNAKQGYYMSGDRVQVEVVTQDANDKPLAASGKIVVYKLLPNEKESKVFEEPIQIDATGREFWTWTASQSGFFRVAYEAIDGWGKKVIGSTSLWVGGPGLSTTQFRLEGVTIVLEKRHYEEGENARILLVADKPDTTVLFTHEAGGDIMHRELVHIAGKSKELVIPIRAEHVPNFSFGAALVKEFQVYQAQQEVFVPPTKQLINVQVESDKDEYKPGEKGSFNIKATDWKGNPARAEVSLALTDASLFYIQKSYLPDIRLFYHGQRRAVSVTVDSHRSGQPEGRIEDVIKYTKYERHSWELPDDFGQLNLPPGSFWNPYMWDGNGYGSSISLNGGLMATRTSHRFSAGGSVAVDAVMAPMAEPARSAPYANDFRIAGEASFESGSGAKGEPAPTAVRSNFAETAFWSPAVVTENGQAKLEVTFPDSLTQWHAEARGLTPTVQVGSGESDVETKKNLIVRLQAPRFFVERDQVVLTANVHNYLKTDKDVKVSLQTGEGLELNNVWKDGVAPLWSGKRFGEPSGSLIIKAGEEARVNWIVDVIKDGKVSIQMSAQSDEESDAVKMEFPVLVHGVQRFTAASGVVREGSGQSTQSFVLNVPKERRIGATNLNVQVNPSLAATMLDALPYLAEYPYGCVEQTMSRFLPSAIVAKVLRDSGVDLATLRKRAKAYEAEAKSKPIGDRIQNSGYTYPSGMPNARDLQQMSSQLGYWARTNNPIYSETETSAMIREGLAMLYEMQKNDGGWGWWPGSEFSDEYMSAYVVSGLATARAAGVSVRSDVLWRGYGYLTRQMKDEDNIHLLTWIAYSLSLEGGATAHTNIKSVVTGRLFAQRERLNAYSKSLLALALWNLGDKAKAAVVVRNLENTAILDEANATARWKMGGDWWHWWNNDVETNAWALRAFLKIDPKNRLTPMLMKWLTLQARGNHWRSTKETAIAVLALADYVRVNKELDVDYTLTVRLGHKMQRTYHVTSENALYFDNRFIVGDFLLENGANNLTIEKKGRGNVYWTAALEYFSLEEPIKASGNEIAIKRRYFKLTRNSKALATENKPHLSTASGVPVPEYLRSEIKDDATLQSGDQIEVELTVDSANDYEYLVFEDMKAPGLEPVELRSGHNWGDGLCSNVELRDEKVALFVDRLPQGTRVLRYRMRAEIPGRFHTLPTNGYAMYAPEVRAISDEHRVGVRD